MPQVFFARYIRTLRQERAQLLAAQNPPPPDGLAAQGAQGRPVDAAHGDGAGVQAHQHEHEHEHELDEEDELEDGEEHEAEVEGAGGAADRLDAAADVLAGAGAGDALLDLFDAPQPDDDPADLDDLCTSPFFCLFLSLFFPCAHIHC